MHTMQRFVQQPTWALLCSRCCFIVHYVAAKVVLRGLRHRVKYAETSITRYTVYEACGNTPAVHLYPHNHNTCKTQWQQARMGHGPSLEYPPPLSFPTPCRSLGGGVGDRHLVTQHFSLRLIVLLCG